ncbi:MAG: hypothetical protein RL609_188 [Bacteroidota bacterium]|jgi:MFS superfamily sulfate permease-like transporter
MSNKKSLNLFQELKNNLAFDATSGFMVALLALPLSLGIASASDFPNPLFGVLTAIIGGIVVAPIMGAQLTIKGPAAGLIVIVASAVAAFGGGEIGWQMTLGAIVVAGLVQILFGVFKLGRLSDLFPITAVHGMLAAIGIIIMSKQLHIVMGVNPVNEAGKPLVEPLELLHAIPHTFSQLLSNPVLQKALLVGLVSLIIVFTWPLIKSAKLKKIPMPLVVLIVAIPLGMMLGLTQENKQLVKVGSFFSTMGVHVSFGGLKQMGTFIQFVALFAIIGSLESLLTAKAVDILDPFKRKSNFNKDLVAVGLGNTVAGVLGGLPMISEVARSSSNVANGGRTRWANFFHGVILFIMVAFLSSVIEMIPKAALAALLIGVGFKLAHPREFKQTLRIGREQLLVFVSTIVFTLAVDLLVGILAGMAMEVLIQWLFKVNAKEIFKAQVKVEDLGNDRFRLVVGSAAVFTNFLQIKKHLDALPQGKHIEIDLSNSKMVDHTVLENLHFFENAYRNEGGHIHLVGLDEHMSLSAHDLAVRVKR